MDSQDLYRVPPTVGNAARHLRRVDLFEILGA